MEGLVVDNFAGGGGASTGIERAIGRPVDIAINHSREAIAMHRANHPATRHYQEDIWQVDPREACGSQRVRLAWFSPDCTHFSRAKGAAPRSKEVRGLADVVIRWARAVHPDTIILENVEEFETWGPLDENGKPDPARAGEDFRRWLGELVGCGYSVEFRSIVAADHGTPTTRRRLFLVARRDGSAIIWPEATHGKGRALPWRTAAEIIDWSLPCPSIFERKRPLAEATLRRIAAGLRRYVIESPSPFIVKYHGGEVRNLHRGQGLDEALRTVDTSNRFGLVTPFVAPVTHTKSGDRTHRLDRPLPVVTTAKGGEFVLVAPTMVQTGYGEREGQRPRVLDLHRPLGTVVGEQKHALIEAFLTKHNGGIYKAPLDEPLSTVTCREHFTAQHVALEPVEAAWIEKLYSSARAGADVSEPLPTVTASGGRGGGHLAEVRAFLVKYYGDSDTQKQRVDRPLDVVTTKARFGLVTVHGQPYQIVDIGLRMLSPRELFNAQGFPASYLIDVECDSRPLTKASKIELAGNSVCGQVAEALVGANLFERRAVA